MKRARGREQKHALVDRSFVERERSRASSNAYGDTLLCEVSEERFPGGDLASLVTDEEKGGGVDQGRKFLERNNRSTVQMT